MSPLLVPPISIQVITPDEFETVLSGFIRFGCLIPYFGVWYHTQGRRYQGADTRMWYQTPEGTSLKVGEGGERQTYKNREKGSYQNFFTYAIYQS